MSKKTSPPKKLQRVTCGPYRRIIIYSGGAAKTGTHPIPLQAKRERKRVSSEKKQLSNIKASKNRFRALVYGNVTPAWTLVTLTFDNDHDPGAKRNVKPYWRRFSDIVRRWVKGTPVQAFKYFRIIEDKHGAGRPHIHLLTNIPESLREEFLSIWPYGEYAQQDMKRIERDPYGRIDVDALCRYLTKERRGLDERLYTTSRNLKRIEREPVAIIPEDMEIMDIPLPEEHFILDRGEWRGRYGYIGFIDFIIIQRE